jgi:hypothetical protein
MHCMFNCRCFIAALLWALLASINVSRAQVIFEPVEYQFGDQDKFYYGGTDPRVFARAAAPVDPGAQWGRIDGYSLASGDVWVHQEVGDQPVRIYSDALPTQNAALYGFTATDAANVANASMPRYFRKADVMAVAKEVHGILVVPARAEFPSAPAQADRSPRPTTRPLMILPAPTAPRNDAPKSDKLAVASH